jgi:2-methylcitrate dehydratase PrpD
VVGLEVGAKLGRALNPNMVLQGWFPVGVLGTVMQTAACAKLLNLSTDQIQMALGIAMNMAAGLRCNNGTMAKPLVSGNLGANGIQAAILAQDGFTANPIALEDKLGFFENFSRGDIAELEKAVDALGDEPLEILQSGISLKRYPCCAGSHMPIDGVLDIVTANSPEPDNIKEIHVSLPERIQYLLIHPRPKTESQAKFSLEYCVARAVMDGEMGLDQFEIEKIRDPEVLPLMEKIRPTYYELNSLPSDRNTPLVEISIKMTDDRVFTSRVQFPRGTVHNPLSEEMHKKKMVQCMSRQMEEDRIEKVLNTLNRFYELEDVTDLVGMLNVKGR